MYVLHAAIKQCSLTKIFHVNCSIPKLTVPLVNFPGIVVTSIVAVLQSQGMHRVPMHETMSKGTNPITTNDFN